MLDEFKKFALKGNVIDLAVGVIIGTAFGKIVSSFVEDIVMPPFGVLIGGINFSHLSLTLRTATESTTAVTLNYGNFLSTLLNFFIISFTIFIVIRQMNKLKKKEEAKPVEPSEQILVLREIRDSLKK
jgi:large conductance mechanosensitive channel